MSWTSKFWLPSERSAADVQSEAYLIYMEFGRKARMPRIERLHQEFPDVPSDAIANWIDTFDSINEEIEKFTAGVGRPLNRENYDSLKAHLSVKFPFMNTVALEKAAYLAWFWSIM